MDILQPNSMFFVGDFEDESIVNVYIQLHHMGTNLIEFLLRLLNICRRHLRLIPRLIPY